MNCAATRHAQLYLFIFRINMNCEGLGPRNLRRFRGPCISVKSKCPRGLIKTSQNNRSNAGCQITAKRRDIDDVVGRGRFVNAV